MNRRVFERYVDQAIQSLPPKFQAALDNIEIVVEDFPDPEVLDDMGAEPGILGLYQGVPLPERMGGEVNLPDKISIYRGPLEEDFPDREELWREIRVTLLHEIGHYFGMDEEELSRLGYE